MDIEINTKGRFKNYIHVTKDGIYIGRLFGVRMVLTLFDYPHFGRWSDVGGLGLLRFMWRALFYVGRGPIGQFYVSVLFVTSDDLLRLFGHRWSYDVNGKRARLVHR